jgi:hypothetical protein
MIDIDGAIRLGVLGTMEQIGDACLTLRGLAADLPLWRNVKTRGTTFAADGANASRPTFLANLPGAVRSEHGAG